MLIVLKTPYIKEISLRELGSLVDYLNAFIDREIEHTEFIFDYKVSTDENVESILCKFKQTVSLNSLSSILTSYLLKEKANMYLDDTTSLLVYEQLLEDDCLKVVNDCMLLQRKYNTEIDYLCDSDADTVKMYVAEICVHVHKIFYEKVELIANDLEYKVKELCLKYNMLLDKKYMKLNEIISSLDWCTLGYDSEGFSLDFQEVKQLPAKTV